MRSKFVVGFALSVFAVIPLAGAQSSTGIVGAPGVAAAAVVASPSPVLAAAVQRSSSVDVRFDVLAGTAAGSGTYDADTGMASFVHNGDDPLTFVSTPDTLYVQGMPGTPTGSIARMNTGGIGAACDFAIATDSRVGLSFLSAMTTANQLSPSDYSGTLDLTRVAGSVSTMKTVEWFSAGTVGTKTAVPFTAKTNSAGYLIAMSASFPWVDGNLVKYNLNLYDFGSPKTVTAPTAGVIAAPSWMYR